jgi:hypothetical protein
MLLGKFGNLGTEIFSIISYLPPRRSLSKLSINSMNSQEGEISVLIKGRSVQFFLMI